MEQIYQSLSDEEQLAAQRIFLKLVEIGGEAEAETEWKPVRRRALRSEFNDVLEQQVLRQLIDANLLVSDQKAETQASTIEIAHEVLLTSWTTLNNWIKGNRQAIALRNRLNDDVTRWQITKKEDELWSGSKLAQVLEIRRDSTFNQVLGGFSSVASQFIDASVGRRDRQRRRTIIGLVSFSTVALILTLLASWQWQRAERQRLTAEADGLGISALRDFESGSGEIEALLKAIQAGQRLKALVGNSPTVEKYPTQSPVFALQKILDSIHEQNRFDGDLSSIDIDSVRVNDVSFSPDRQKIAIARRNGNVEIWDKHGREIAQWQTHKEDWLEYISFSPDGKHIATMGGDGWVRLWDVESKSKIAEFGGEHILFPRKDNMRGTLSLDFINLHSEKRQFRSVIVSHNVLKVALVTVDIGGNVQLWNWSGELIAPLKDHKGIVKSVIFAPTGQHIVTVENDDSAQLWDTAGKPLMKLEKVLDVEDGRFRSQEFTRHNVSFSPDGKRIATIGKDQVVRIWNLQGEKIAQIEGSFLSVLFTPDGKYLAIQPSDKSLGLWNLSNLKPIDEFDRSMEIDRIRRRNGNGSGVPFYETFSRDGQRFALVGHLGRIAILDWSGAQLAWLKVFNQPFVSASSTFRYGVAFSPDWEYLVAGTSGNQFKLWNLSERQLTKWTAWKAGTPIGFLTPDRQYIATFTENNEIQLRNLSGSIIANWGKYKGDVKAVFFSPKYSNNQYIATTEDDSNVKVWDSSGKLIRKLNTTLSAADWDSVSFSLDGSQIAVLDGDNTVSLWSVSTDSSNPLAKWATGYPPGSDGFVYSQSHSPNLRYVATAGQYGKAQIFDTTKQQTIQLQGHEGIVRNITFSSDGQYVATAGNDGTARLWNLSGHELKQFLHQDFVSSISFSPDNKFLATNDLENTVRIWTLSGTQVAEFKAKPGDEGQVTFSPDGKQIILVGSTVQSWKIEGLDDLLAQGCNWLEDYLKYNPNVPENQKHICDKAQ